MAQSAEIWYVASQLVLLDVRMRSFLCGLSLVERQGIMPQTNFPILGNFYQKNMAEDSNLLDLFSIKLRTQMWSINRLVNIIKAGQSFLLKIGSRH